MSNTHTVYEGGRGVQFETTWMQKGSYILHGGAQFCGVGCEGALICHLSEKALLEDWPNRLKKGSADA